MITFCNWTAQVTMKIIPGHHNSYKHSEKLVSITQVFKLEARSNFNSYTKLQNCQSCLFNISLTKVH